MRFRTGFVVGFAVGYVLGTKAGRERYEEIVASFRTVTGDERVQRVTSKGQEIIGQSTEKVREVISQGLGNASRKAREAAETG